MSKSFTSDAAPLSSSSRGSELPSTAATLAPTYSTDANDSDASHANHSDVVQDAKTLASQRRRKNADAQAAFRARRANYIANLEETVTSLESAVRQLQDACREAHDDADDLRTENVKLLAVIESMKQREVLWRTFWESKPELRSRMNDGPSPSAPPPPSLPHSDFTYDPARQYPAPTHPQQPQQQQHQFTQPAHVRDYGNTENVAQNFPAVHHPSFQVPSRIPPNGNDRSDYASFVAYAQAGSEYDPQRLRVRTDATGGSPERPLNDLSRVPPNFQQGYLRIPQGSISSSSSPALPSPPVLSVGDLDGTAATTSSRGESPTPDPSPPTSSSGQATATLNSNFTNLSLFNHSVDDISLDFLRGQQHSPFDWMPPNGLTSYHTADEDEGNIFVASESGPSNSGLQPPRVQHRRANSDNAGMELYAGMYTPTDVTGNYPNGIPQNGGTSQGTSSVPTSTTKERPYMDFPTAPRGLIRSHSRRHTFPVSPISPESPTDDGGDEEGEEPQRLSNTLAVIKAQAFGTVRKTRAKAKKSSGADQAAKLALEALHARAAGLGLDMGSGVGVMKRRRILKESS